jgi:hypothetical protein
MALSDPAFSRVADPARANIYKRSFRILFGSGTLILSDQEDYRANDGEDRMQPRDARLKINCAFSKN